MGQEIEKTHIDCCTEFGYELQLVIPYAYYLHTHGRLGSTQSCLSTKEMYYFSPEHIEKYELRQPNNPNTPNSTPHTTDFRYDQWIPPPYKDIYKNNLFVFPKPLLIIHNKYNIEWHQRPVNFLDIPTLDTLFQTLKAKYTIVYIRPASNLIVDDKASRILGLREEAKLLRRNRIMTGEWLYEQNKGACANFNHFQFMLHANCNHFISVQGGNSVLASYFGGTNIIYAKGGNELWCNAYENLYKRFSNCNVFNAQNYEDFLTLVRTHY